MPAADLERFGDYRVLRELGRGGMGIVYEVEREDTGGRFALKTLTLGLGHDPELAARFVREGQLAARLDHPHVVRTHAASFAGTRPWIVQDLLPGGSLHEHLRARGPLPVEEAVEVARKVALGLAHAHERGVLHRDVKPENVLFDEEGEPRLVDFGVARATVTGASGRLTATGQVIGSPAFMAPEQALGDPVDARADVHAVGALLYTLLTGDPPFVGASTMETLEAVISRPPRPLRSSRPDVPEAVERVVLRALAKRPDDRFPGAAALAAALAECRAPATRPSRLVPALVAASVSTTVLAALALFMAARGDGPPTRAPLPAPTPAPAPVRVDPATEAPSPPARVGWPGWGATLREPRVFEVAWDERDLDHDVVTLTFRSEPAAVSGDRATVAMRVIRVRLALTKMAGTIIDFDSDRMTDGPPQPFLVVPGTQAAIEATLNAAVSVDLDVRTGKVHAVTGMPALKESELGLLAHELRFVLSNGAVLAFLDNVMHLFPEAAEPTLMATAWLDWAAGLRAWRAVAWDEAGGLHHRLSGPVTPVAMPGFKLQPGAEVRSIELEATLAGERIVRSDLRLDYDDPSGQRNDARFSYRLLDDPR